MSLLCALILLETSVLYKLFTYLLTYLIHEAIVIVPIVGTIIASCIHCRNVTSYS